MSNDLPIIPCYDSTNCKNIFNCAPDTNNCPEMTPITQPLATTPECPSGQLQMSCYGSDPNYCSGIIQQCDPNLGYKCRTDISNPAQNYFSEYLGCDVKSDPSCMDFQNQNSNLCQSECWDLGGASEVDKTCNSHFKDQNSCDSMKYFCKWSGGKCRGVDEDPWESFLSYSPKSAGLPKTVFSENINGNTLNCAQSSWSSTQQTSYADTTRTCCVTIAGNKKCITTPRCQHVDTSCECGFKDIHPSQNPTYGTTDSLNPPLNPTFMCQDSQQSLIVNDKVFIKKGYCTWCKGTQLKDFDYRDWLIKNNYLTNGRDIRDSIAWGTPDNCKNRCSTYNDCEINDSEKLWNECIWRNSNGAFGINPDTPDTSSSDFSKGFCYSAACLESAVTDAEISECNALKQLKTTCEMELANKVSTKNQAYPITTGFIPSPRCTEGTSWFHSCVKANNDTFAQNYACGWCPNLQNDWPENPCPKNSAVAVGSNWFAPLGVDNPGSGVGVIFGILAAIAFVIACVALGIWRYKLYH